MIGMDTPDGLHWPHPSLETNDISRMVRSYPESSDRSISPEFQTTEGIQFDVSSLKSNALYSHLEVFKEALSDVVGFEKGKEISFDDLLNHVFERLEEYTSEELIGLALYLVNMLLIHRDSLPAESEANLFESVVQLIEVALSNKNPTALFIAIEVLGSLESSRAHGTV